MAKENLAAFLIPRVDEYKNEYVDPLAERLAWISGFTGTAGIAAVTENDAALFTDGRYTLQARRQSGETLWKHRHSTNEPLAAGFARLCRKAAGLGLILVFILILRLWN